MSDCWSLFCFVLRIATMELMEAVLLSITTMMQAILGGTMARRRFYPYMGWITNSDTYDFYLYNIKPYVQISTLKRIVSKRDREENRHDSMEINRVA